MPRSATACTRAASTCSRRSTPRRPLRPGSWVSRTPGRSSRAGSPTWWSSTRTCACVGSCAAGCGRPERGCTDPGRPAPNLSGVIWIVLGLLVAWVAIGPWVLVAVVVALFVPRIRWWVQDRIWISWPRAGIAVAVLATITGVIVLVPDGWLPIPQAPGLMVVPSYVGRPALQRPVQVATIPQNPHLARNGASSMHNDAAASGTYAWAGPTGLEPEVDTSW